MKKKAGRSITIVIKMMQNNLQVKAHIEALDKFVYYIYIAYFVVTISIFVDANINKSFSCLCQPIYVYR